MKIIVLGGAGDMGSRAVEDLASSPGVTRVTIADGNLEAAKKLAARLSGREALVDAKEVDANDHYALVSAIQGYDAVASALGPFHQFEVKLVRAALFAGVDYASICDEWEPARAVIDGLNEEARKNERTIITGLGASPGVSNVMVRYLAGQLDRTRRADVYVYMPINAGGGQAVIRHMAFILKGEVSTWRGEKRVMVPALSKETVVEFPRFGSEKLWNMGHSEPETIPRYLPGIEEVNFYMGLGKGSGPLIRAAKMGLFNSKRRSEAVVRLVDFIESLGEREPDWGSIRVDVWGELKGKDEHRMICGIGQMREVTGLSLSIGTLMLANQELLTEEGGVYAPEACIEPKKFIAYMKARGVEAYEDLAMTRSIE